MTSVATPAGARARSTPAPDLARALSRPRVAGLDFLRAVAVLLVLADHSGLTHVGPLAIIDGGLGVEAFFVISGFLITWLLLGEHEARGRITLLAFYRRRVARLMPAMLLYMAVGMTLLLATGRPVPWGAVASTALHVVNYYQAFTGAASHYLSHCWSLAVEEQFYLLWPALLLVLLRRGWPLARVLAGALLGLWALKVVLVLGVGISDEYAYRALEMRADQLLVGCLLAVLLKSAAGRHWFERQARRRWVAGAVLVALLASTALLRDSMVAKYLLGYSIEPVLVALLLPLVVLAAQGEGWPARLLNLPFMVLVGQISYGVYLYHPFVMHPVRKGVERLSGAPGLGIGVSMLAVIGVAWLSFRWVEQPLRERWRGR